MELPDFIKVTVDDELFYADLLARCNLTAGFAMGLNAKLEELEEQLKLALEYQREVDARLVEKMGNAYEGDLAKGVLKVAAAFIRRGKGYDS